MAQADNVHHFDSLRLSADADGQPAGPAQHGDDISFSPVPPLGEASAPVRPIFRTSAASQDTIRAAPTPPMDIPSAHDHSLPMDDTSSYIDQYMRQRNPSVSFDHEIQLDSGQRQSMTEPLEKPRKAARERGRSMLQALADDKKASRAHSEGERSHYDPITGRHLPQYSHSPPREHARVGESRFPLLQATVDEMARESGTTLPHALSLTSESTMSPNEQVLTPRDTDDYPLSPTSDSPMATLHSQSYIYDEAKAFRRTASQRWRDGDPSTSPQDFFARAGSLRNKSMRDLVGRNRRDTSGSTRSPRSAASSYLRAFSISSGTNGDGLEPGPLSCDFEGQTIGEDYVLGKQIGYGGFSTIRQVTQFHDGQQRTLAVKIVRRHLDNKTELENEQAQAEFEHEVELWRFLQHRNILPLEAVYKLEEATFCFIPLNLGGTLFDLVRNNRRGIPHETAKSYSYQLASALRYLHLDARVVHRDIKLENCLIEPDDMGGPGLLRVCDFGMAEWLSADGASGPPSPNFNQLDRPPPKRIGPADTSTSAFTGGSLEYAAPEIVHIAERSDDDTPADRAIISPSVDMWAFGVCLYSMIVGSRPFQNTFQPRVVMAILAGDWNRDALLSRGGDAVHELVSGCLDMEETSRWDVTRVLGCSWLEDLVESEGDEGVGGWRL